MKKMAIKRNFNELSDFVIQHFDIRYISTLGFGSYFNQDERQKGDVDLDIAIILNGTLDKSALDLIKKVNLDLSEKYGKDIVKHAPFYLFSGETQINDMMSRHIFLKGYNHIADEKEFYKIFGNMTEPNDTPQLTLAKEHTHFARRCLVDNILFTDNWLNEKIFKNHTTIAMRNLIYLSTGKIYSDGFDVWQKYGTGVSSYKEAVGNLGNEEFRLKIHSSIIKDIGVHSK